MKKKSVFQKIDVFGENAIANLSKSWVTLVGLVVSMLILLGTIVVYMQRIQVFLYGSKWLGSGLDVIFIVNDQIFKLLGYLVITLIFYLVLNSYRKYHNFQISGKTIFNLIVIFISIIALNDLVKLICANFMVELPKSSPDYVKTFGRMEELKNFATGLDLLLVNQAGVIKRLLEAINIFSILGFSYIYTQLTKLRKNSLPIVLILVVVFVIVTVTLDSINLIQFISWSE